MTAICALSGSHLRHMRGGVWPEIRADGASKLKLPTWWNAAGMLVVAVLAAFASVSTEARAMLVYSYYSDQIIVTTDERRSGPVDFPPEVGPSIAACWRAPHEGDQITVQLSFRAGCFWLESRWGFPNRGDFDSTCWLGGGQQECRSRTHKTYVTG